jgi:hypothetical protein
MATNRPVAQRRPIAPLLRGADGAERHPCLASRSSIKMRPELTQCRLRHHRKVWTAEECVTPLSIAVLRGKPIHVSLDKIAFRRKFASEAKQQAAGPRQTIVER